MPLSDDARRRLTEYAESRRRIDAYARGSARALLRQADNAEDRRLCELVAQLEPEAAGQ